jgi:hypothetical protein
MMPGRPNKGGLSLRRFSLLFAGLVLALGTGSVYAETIANKVARFSGLDKITGRITQFDVYVNETVQFGALQITPRDCYSRPPTETERNTVFVEVDQVTLKGSINRVFTGWMFADSPALNAIDHPVYDIWLVTCAQTSDVPPPDAPVDAPVPKGAANAPDQKG